MKDSNVGMNKLSREEKSKWSLLHVQPLVMILHTILSSEALPEGFRELGCV